MSKSIHSLKELASLVDAGDLLGSNEGLYGICIDGLLHQKDTMNIIAPGAMNPAWIGLHLSMCLATGKAWCGRHCHQGKTLFIDCNFHTDTVVEYVSEVARKMGVKQPDIKGELGVAGLGRENSALDVLLKNTDTIRSSGYKTIVISGFERELYRNGELKTTAPIIEAYRKVNRIESETGCSLILVHAYYAIGKGVGDWDMDSLLDREADTHVVIRPKKYPGWFSVDASMRNFAPIPRFAVKGEYPILVKPEKR